MLGTQRGGVPRGDWEDQQMKKGCLGCLGMIGFAVLVLIGLAVVGAVFGPPHTDAPVTQTVVDTATLNRKRDDFLKVARLDTDPFGVPWVNNCSVGMENGHWKIIIMVNNNWHLKHKQIRLQAAQVLFQAWSMTATGKPGSDNVDMDIVDYNQNKVGGYSFWSGVWVHQD